MLFGVSGLLLLLLYATYGPNPIYTTYAPNPIYATYGPNLVILCPAVVVAPPMLCSPYAPVNQTLLLCALLLLLPLPCCTAPMPL